MLTLYVFTIYLLYKIIFIYLNTYLFQKYIRAILNKWYCFQYFVISSNNDKHLKNIAMIMNIAWKKVFFLKKNGHFVLLSGSTSQKSNSVRFRRAAKHIGRL